LQVEQGTDCKSTPAGNKDVNFSDSWIDYNNTAAGIITWGIIQFEIAY